MRNTKRHEINDVVYVQARPSRPHEVGRYRVTGVQDYTGTAWPYEGYSRCYYLLDEESGLERIEWEFKVFDTAEAASNFME